MGLLSWFRARFLQRSRGLSFDDGLLQPVPRNEVVDAASVGNVDELRNVVAKYGAEFVRLEDDPVELTSLHWAAAAGNLDSVEYLLSDAVGSDPNAARDNDFTPLHSAAMNGHARVCERLIRAGTGINVQTDPQRYAALHSAAYGGHEEAIRVLLANGADPTLKNYRGECPADTARRQGNLAAAQLIESTASNG
ncbi:MAG: ankyrin repeat domain-containing protein [Phycisphaeraceae bacterium]|nr:ankyrin repeat domain-containing protein [Phycisphaeraceae bacterium]